MSSYLERLKLERAIQDHKRKLDETGDVSWVERIQEETKRLNGMIAEMDVSPPFPQQSVR